MASATHEWLFTCRVCQFEWQRDAKCTPVTFIMTYDSRFSNPTYRQAGDQLNSIVAKAAYN